MASSEEVLPVELHLRMKLLGPQVLNLHALAIGVDPPHAVATQATLIANETLTHGVGVTVVAVRGRRDLLLRVR